MLAAGSGRDLAGGETAPGYQLRLLQEIHDNMRKLMRCVFEGNGEPALMTRMQRQEDAHADLRKDYDKDHEILSDMVKKMIDVHRILILLTAIISAVGVPLLVAVLIALATGQLKIVAGP